MRKTTKRATCRKLQANPAVNERGVRIGQDHPRAKLSDHEIELMRRLHEEYERGHPQHIGIRKLAVKFEVSKEHARRICNYMVRNQRRAA